MHIYIYTHIHIYIYTYIHTHIYIYIYTYLWGQILSGGDRRQGGRAWKGSYNEGTIMCIKTLRLRLPIRRKLGDDTVGNPPRAQIARFELFDIKFLNTSFSNLSSYWIYVIVSYRICFPYPILEFALLSSFELNRAVMERRLKGMFRSPREGHPRKRNCRWNA